MPSEAPFRVPRIKVCGIQSMQDLGQALTLGCDAVGFVEFPRSPRSLTPSAAGRVIDELPAEVLSVAVMVDRTPDFARSWLDASGARAVQLCGEERAEDWRDFGAPVLRRVAVGYGAERELERWAGVACAFVLDHPDSPGGSGREVHAGIAAKLVTEAPCLLAGGLGPENVERRVQEVGPYGVDASSRLESKPGHKDAALVEEYVRKAHAALSALGPASTKEPR